MNKGNTTWGVFTNAKIQLHPTSSDGLNDTQFYDTDRVSSLRQ